MSNDTIIFLSIITVGFLIMFLWMYIDGLKFKARHAQIDADFYKKMYDLEALRRSEIVTKDYNS